MNADLWLKTGDGWVQQRLLRSQDQLTAAGAAVDGISKTMCVVWIPTDAYGW
jgi:hypothetical protein